MFFFMHYNLQHSLVSSKTGIESGDFATGRFFFLFLFWGRIIAEGLGLFRGVFLGFDSAVILL